MKPRSLICLFLSLVFALQPVAAAAMETDQYNLPPVPLADTGDEVTEHVEDSLRKAVAKVNADIAHSKTCIDIDSPMRSKCDSVGNESRKLAYLRSNDAIAREMYKLLGDGNIFISYMGNWMNTHEFKAKPARYKSDYGSSIYIAHPVDYATLSPTVRLFGTEFGTDKLDHLFQQGYTYYTIQRDGAAKGLSQDDAAKKAVKWGQMTERTYFGLLISGVYSNADLYANYAGMKFYRGLTEPIAIGEKTRPAAVALKDGKWQIDDARLSENLLKPFITDHLNEAFNPSGYAFNLIGSVRRIVKKYDCPEWQQTYPNLTAAALTDKSKALESWNGEDYGYTKRDRTVRIGETCFSQLASSQ
jgi:hypothetical protein